MATLVDFSGALLTKLGLPRTQNRLLGLVAFGAIEGGHWHNSATFNPLNTMRDAPGATQASGLLKGIKAYPDWQTGIAATAATIAQSNMRPIAIALRDDVSPRQFLTAVTQSAWCPGCDYTPFDPVALYKQRGAEQDSGRTPLKSTGDLVMEWGPWILAGLGVLAVGGVWYYQKQRGRSLFEVGASEGPRKRKRKRRRALSNPARPVLTA